MSVAGELQLLGRVSFRQLLAILLAGIVVWWLVSIAFSGSLQLLLRWLVGTDVEVGQAFLMGGISQSVVKTLGNVVGAFAGMWASYGTFCTFKNAKRSNIDDLQGFGQMTVRQVGMIFLSGLVAWWGTYAALSLPIYLFGMLWGFSDSDFSLAMGVVLIVMRTVGHPIIGCVSLVAGLWVGFNTFGRYKSHLEANIATEGSMSH